jgi:hypothetical protein
MDAFVQQQDFEALTWIEQRFLFDPGIAAKV